MELQSFSPDLAANREQRGAFEEMVTTWIPGSGYGDAILFEFPSPALGSHPVG